MLIFIRIGTIAAYWPDGTYSIFKIALYEYIAVRNVIYPDYPTV